jgi:5-methyltetrahydrofolate--homocysteine methyltransferase
MQLPFVLQSAETMKAAVSYLEPFMERVEGSSRGTMVLATVKGDVHDIGKNLVDIILSNNGYRVVNLGIKQPIENIIAAAVEQKADCIGMSGLLVKSTVIMKENLEVLNQRGIDVPVVLGGAALTRRYVEQDCRQVYNGLVVYGQDAFDDLKFMEALANKGRDGLASLAGVSATATEQNADSEAAKKQAVAASKAISASLQHEVAVSSAQGDVAEPTGNGDGPSHEQKVAASERIAARLGVKPSITSMARSDVARGLPIPTPPFWGTRVIDNINLADVFPYINETVLIKGQWRVRQGETPKEEYDRLLAEKIYPVLTRLKQQSIDEKLLIPKVIYGYFPCQSDGNDLIIYREDKRSEWLRFTFPRQDHGRSLCISDFFASTEEGIMDVLPVQVVTMGLQASVHSQKLFETNKYTDYLYFHGLSVESAEALAEHVHKQVRQELGFGGEDAKEMRKLLNQGYRGSRYSPGYPACPYLEDQAKIFELLKPELIDVTLTEEFHIVPEQSTSAIVVCHPEAKYFNISRNPVAHGM